MLLKLGFGGFSQGERVGHCCYASYLPTAIKLFNGERRCPNVAICKTLFLNAKISGSVV